MKSFNSAAVTGGKALDF